MSGVAEAAIISGVFSLIQALVQYLRSVDVSEEVIEANWVATKQKVYSRPSEKLPIIPKPGTESE